MSSIIERLDSYYRSTGISATHFECRHRHECKQACGDFVSPREAYVGSDYDQDHLPRLLFVSADAADAHPGRDPQLRTLSALRAWEEKHCVVKGLRKGRHWYETHAFAFAILEQFIHVTRGPALALQDVHRHFAHTNTAKCKDVAKGSAQGSNTLFRNCAGFLRDEITILEPAVIIPQGKKAKTAVNRAFTTIERLQCPNDPRYGCSLVDVNGRMVLRIGIVHPSPRARRYVAPEKQLAYQWYVDVAAALLSRGQRAAGFGAA